MVEKLKKKDVKSKERKAKYKKYFGLWVSGLNMQEIADQENCHPSTVERACQWCKECGLSTMPDLDEFILKQQLDKHTRKMIYRKKLDKKGLKIKEMSELEKMVSQLEKEERQLRGLEKL